VRIFRIGPDRQQAATRATPDSNLDAVIESYELAWRMQQVAPEVLDLSTESPEALALSGIGEKATDSYGRECLMARRLAEAGGRYIQVNYTDNSNNPAWDQHTNMPKHAEHARAVDRPIAGLLTDLKRRGLLEDTLVWWGGEFGRNPYAQDNGTGRDHDPDGFTVWLAGGGVKAGFSHGATDEFGHRAVEGRTHMHDLHATVLHLLGLDHERLTYRHAGRDFRLTDVAGRVIHEILRG
jgi:arylsulfatase A-like enzyme